MTENTAIERLDYSKPPPGYRIDEQDGEFDWYVGDDVSPDNGNASLITTEADALREAWEDYKVENDPPGVWAGQARGEHPGGYGFGLMEADHEHPLDADCERIDDARAAAWDWHDRRRAIVVDIDDQTCSGGRGLAAWLASALAWTEAECSEIEAYAALPFPRSVDMPQALQRVLLPEAAR